MTVREYHAALTGRLHAILGERLVGVYASGSFGLDDFDSDVSDLDVFAVSGGTIARSDKWAIVAGLRHEALPCPARGLEFVLYPVATARFPTSEAGFALNLNTGPRMTFHVDEEPGTIARHWFALDRAIVRESGVALYGPPPAAVFAPIPRALLAPVVAESLEWHLVPGNSSDDDAVLNACRSLFWLCEHTFASKSTAGGWALERVDDPELVEAALAARHRGRDLGRQRVERFVSAVLAEARFTSAVA